MICQDCADEADFDALPGLQKVALGYPFWQDDGHGACKARNADRQSKDCACQHRTPKGKIN